MRVRVVLEVLGHVARMEEWRVVHKVLVGKPEGERERETTGETKT